ncbi:hypothetical protein GJ496_006460 [Pomphorhynchus laevis]|nr:hypothetical protein GJ496_006460 [Pomphorhynchus laevis]
MSRANLFQLTTRSNKEAEIYFQIQSAIKLTNAQIELNKRNSIESHRMVYNADRSVKEITSALNRMMGRAYDLKCELRDMQCKEGKSIIRKYLASGLRISADNKLKEITRRQAYARNTFKFNALNIRSDQNEIDQIKQEIRSKDIHLNKIKQNLKEVSKKSKILKDMKNFYLKISSRARKLNTLIGKKCNIHSYTYLAQTDPKKYHYLMAKFKMQKMYVNEIQLLEAAKSENQRLRSQMHKIDQEVARKKHALDKLYETRKSSGQIGNGNNKLILQLTRVKNTIHRNRTVNTKLSHLLELMDYIEYTITLFKDRIRLYARNKMFKELQYAIDLLNEFRAKYERRFVPQLFGEMYLDKMYEFDISKVPRIPSLHDIQIVQYKKRRCEYDDICYRFNIGEEYDIRQPTNRICCLQWSKSDSSTLLESNDDYADFFDNPEAAEIPLGSPNYCQTDSECPLRYLCKSVCDHPNYDKIYEKYIIEDTGFDISIESDDIDTKDILSTEIDETPEEEAYRQFKELNAQILYRDVDTDFALTEYEKHKRRYIYLIEKDEEFIENDLEYFHKCLKSTMEFQQNLPHWLQ